MAPAPVVEGAEPRSANGPEGKKDRPMTYHLKGKHGHQQSTSPQPMPTRPPQGAGPPSRPGGPPSPQGPPQQGSQQGPPSGSSQQGWPRGGNPKQGPPQRGPPQEDKHCFKNAGGTEICVAKQWDHYNNTKVFGKDGTYDRHNDYGNKEDKDIAGNIPGTNVTEALQGGREPHDGNTLFQVHDNENSEGFRDTHSQNWDGKHPKSGPPQYDDHKVDASNKNKQFEEHSNKNNGDRTDMKNQGQSENKDLTDVHDQNGSTDITNIKSFAGDWLELFHKHHGVDGNDWSKDSSVTKHANVSNQHQQEEQTGKDGFYEFQEQDSSKGSFNFHVNGNDAWKDLAEETSNFPKNFTEVHRRSEAGTIEKFDGGILAAQDQLSNNLASKALTANVLGSAKSTMCLWSANSTVSPSDTWTECFREADAAGKRILDLIKSAYFNNVNIPAEAINNAGPMLQYAYTEALVKMALNNQTIGDFGKHHDPQTVTILAGDITHADDRDGNGVQTKNTGNPKNTDPKALQHIRGSMKLGADLLSAQGAIQIGKKIEQRNAATELVEFSLQDVPAPVLEALSQLSSPDPKVRESALFKLLKGTEVVMVPFSIDKEMLGKLLADNTSILNISLEDLGGVAIPINGTQDQHNAARRSIGSDVQEQIAVVGSAQLAKHSCSVDAPHVRSLWHVDLRKPPKAVTLDLQSFALLEICMHLFGGLVIFACIRYIIRSVRRNRAHRAEYRAWQAEQEALALVEEDEKKYNVLASDSFTMSPREEI